MKRWRHTESTPNISIIAVELNHDPTSILDEADRYPGEERKYRALGLVVSIGSGQAGGKGCAYSHPDDDLCLDIEQMEKEAQKCDAEENAETNCGLEMQRN